MTDVEEIVQNLDWTVDWTLDWTRLSGMIIIIIIQI